MSMDDRNLNREQFRLAIRLGWAFVGLVVSLSILSLSASASIVAGIIRGAK